MVVFLVLYIVRSLIVTGFEKNLCARSTFCQFLMCL